VSKWEIGGGKKEQITPSKNGDDKKPITSIAEVEPRTVHFVPKNNSPERNSPVNLDKYQ